MTAASSWRSEESSPVSSAAKVGDRVRFWEETASGDELTFEGTVTRVQIGYSGGPALLSIHCPLGSRDRLSDDVEVVSRV